MTRTWPWVLAIVASVGCSPNRPAPANGKDAGIDASADAPSDTPDADVPYPPPPYGLDVGQTLPLLAFQGYRDGTGPWTSLSTSAYYDPDGSRGIRGLMIVVSAQWCPPCNDLAKVLPGYYRTFQPQGAKFLSLLVANDAHEPADQSTVDQWLASYPAIFDSGVDPTKLLADGVTRGYPTRYYVDPRTMRITAIVEAVAPGDSLLELHEIVNANTPSDAGPAGDGG